MKKATLEARGKNKSLNFFLKAKIDVWSLGEVKKSLIKAIQKSENFSQLIYKSRISSQTSSLIE